MTTRHLEPTDAKLHSPFPSPTTCLTIQFVYFLVEAAHICIDRTYFKPLINRVGRGTFPEIHGTKQELGYIELPASWR
jgi:hypothetical protein